MLIASFINTSTILIFCFRGGTKNLNEHVNKNMSLKIVVVVVSILLVLTTCTSIYLYTAPDIELENQVNSLIIERDSLKQQVFDLIVERDALPTPDQVNSLIAERDTLKQQVNALTNERDDLEAQIIYLQATISTIQGQVDALRAPKLVTALAVVDQRPLFQTPYFEITGTVWNVGSETATNCRLHVIMYQGSTIAENTYITLSTINGESYRNVDEQIFYVGSQITDWEIIPEMD